MSVKIELQSIVENFLENRKYQSFLALSLLLQKKHTDISEIKSRFCEQYFFDMRLFDLSFYFLLYLSKSEQISLIEKWLEISHQLPEKQKIAINRLSDLFLK